MRSQTLLILADVRGSLGGCACTPGFDCGPLLRAACAAMLEQSAVSSSMTSFRMQVMSLSDTWCATIPVSQERAGMAEGCLPGKGLSKQPD
jgi:hypothetical protein